MKVFKTMQLSTTTQLLCLVLTSYLCPVTDGRALMNSGVHVKLLHDERKKSCSDFTLAMSIGVDVTSQIPPCYTNAHL